MACRIEYYNDVTRHHETSPCLIRDKMCPSMDEAETVAKKELPAIRTEHGASVGYLITDTKTGRMRIGPGVDDDAQNHK